MPYFQIHDRCDRLGLYHDDATFEPDADGVMVECAEISDAGPCAEEGGRTDAVSLSNSLVNVVVSCDEES